MNQIINTEFRALRPKTYSLKKYMKKSFFQKRRRDRKMCHKNKLKFENYKRFLEATQLEN